MLDLLLLDNTLIPLVDFFGKMLVDSSTDDSDFLKRDPQSFRSTYIEIHLGDFSDLVDYSQPDRPPLGPERLAAFEQGEITLLYRWLGDIWGKVASHPLLHIPKG